MPETEPKSYEITVKLSETGTIIDPDTGKRHKPEDEVTISADEFGNPLSQHWRRALKAKSCARVEKKKGK